MFRWFHPSMTILLTIGGVVRATPDSKKRARAPAKCAPARHEPVHFLAALPTNAQTPEDKPVPILSGSIGTFSFVTAGQNLIDTPDQSGAPRALGRSLAHRVASRIRGRIPASARRRTLRRAGRQARGLRAGRLHCESVRHGHGRPISYAVRNLQRAPLSRLDSQPCSPTL